MKNLITLLLVVFSIGIKAQDTFSIVAVDSITGEVGSAGASCVPIALPAAPHGALIICDVLPGIGAINTQAYWLAANQQTAHSRMIAGDSAQGIIDWVITHDSQNNPAIRQYGVVELNGGHPRSAAYTGVNCMDYKNHITGPGYSIQGNILLGQQILDSMEARYLNSSGTLSDKLMAALQGANVIGADSRCAPYGLSSLSSFIRVAKPSDTTGTYSVDLYMAYPGNSNWSVDPIDSLQTLYDQWLILGVDVKNVSSSFVKVCQDESNFIFKLKDFDKPGNIQLELFDLQARKLVSSAFDTPDLTISKSKINYTEGILFYRITNGNSILVSGKIGH